MIDWTKPIRWKEHPDCKLHFVGFSRGGNAVIDTGNPDQYGESFSVRKKDGTGDYPSDFTVENIPERVERWVIGDPRYDTLVRWFKTEEEALVHLAMSKLGYSKPIRIEVEMP